MLAPIAPPAPTDHEATLKQLFEQAPGFIAVLEGPRHVFTLANAAYYRLVGKRELIGRTVDEAFPEVRVQGFLDMLDGVYGSGEPYVGQRLPLRFSQGDGEPPDERYLDFVYQPVRASDGRITGIFVQGHDVTEHVALEQQRDAQRRVFDVTLSSIEDFAYTFDGERRFTYANKPLLDLLGIDLAAIVGKNFAELPYPPELAARLDDEIGAVFATGRRVVGETFYASPTGQDGWYEYIFNPVLDGEGRVVTVAGSTRDVTSRVLQERRLEALAASERAARADAERANRFKDEFLATLSHELRTPLNAILGWSELLLSGRLTAEQMKDAAERISRNSRAQGRLIADLLDMNGIVSGKVRLGLERVALARPLAAALDAVRLDARKKNVALRCGPPDSSLLVDGDPDRLQQVFWNLLSNAVKFTPEGGSVTVATSADADDDDDEAGGGTGQATVRIADSGVGLAADFLPRLFERFSQADSSSTRRYGGLGLGLSICKSLVEMHGGRIAAHSDGPGRGTTFEVTLPLAPAGSAAEPESRWGELAPAPAFTDPLPLQGARILVVDDDDEGREVIASMLRQYGAVTFAAGSAAEALEALRSASPALLLCDIGMPDVDGYELLRRVRETSEVPVVALTAFARPEDRQHALDSGFSAHIAKPAEPASVVRACSLALGLAEPR